ncbi:MAG TPA: FkbM family methyltransferase [Gammaproteobacteria bacterium]
MINDAAVYIYRKIAGALRGTGIGRFHALRKFDAFLVSRLSQRQITIHGHRMILDKTDSLRLSINHEFEPCETKLLDEQLQEGDVVLDIGANIGYYTLLAARKVGAKGRVYAFEPDPMNFSLLKQNIELNGYTNVELVNKAVGETSADLKLYLSDVNTGDHRTYESEGSRRAITIPCTSIDDYFRGSVCKITFIKMDIQGFECRAMRGMRETLGNCTAVKLTTEFWPYGLVRAGDSPEELIGLLEQNGFKLYDIDEATRSVGPADVAKLLSQYHQDTQDFTNLFCVKQA